MNNSSTPSSGAPANPSHDPFLGKKLGLISRVDHHGHRVAWALGEAASEGYVDVLRYLIEKSSANPNARSPFGETPMFLAARCGQIDALRYLLTVGDAALFDNMGWTPLMAAAAAGQTEACLVLAPHAKPADVTGDGSTALMIAAQENKHACIPILASCCRLGARNIEGRDALSVAAVLEHVDVVQALLALTPGPTDASIAKALSVSNRGSGGAAELNSAGQALQRVALMRKELRDIGVASQPSKTSSKAPSIRL